MCGIVGAITKKRELPFDAMVDLLTHRGPDDRGVFTTTADSRTIYLGMRRLAIIDLSPAGHQPMKSASETLCITYNGELYNFQDIKSDLAHLGISFRSRSDTEVMLAAFEQWGVKALDRFNGMFALALWNASDNSLLLVRDHAGQKPLYYAPLPDGGLVWASEIKAILASDLIEPRVNQSALPGYLASLRVHEPDTMFEGIFKLPAAHSLVWRGGAITIGEWWNPSENSRQFSGTFRDAVDQLDSLFSKSVKRHMIADVPVGAFLSGGLDSSLIVREATRSTGTPLVTFTTGFRAQDALRDTSGKNELVFARMLRDSLGNKVDYRELILEPDILDLLPRVVWHLDEPICDPAEINAYIICKHARASGITVLLSGMGGDEIFAGYNHYLMAWKLRNLDWIQWILNPVLKSVLFIGAPAFARSASLHPALRYLARKGKFLLMRRDERSLGLTAWQTDSEVHALLSGQQSVPDSLASKRRHFMRPASADLLTRQLYTDFKTFLSEHNLMYTDKMSMASSCEVRSPFLDREIVEFAFSLPNSFKLNGTTGKYILKKFAERSLPSELIYQKKTGFALPIRSWKSQIQELARDLLAPEKSAMQYFNPGAVHTLIEKHAREYGDTSYELWSLITFALWYQIAIEKKGVHP